MLLECLWPALCLGAVGCGSFESRAYSSQRTQTLAPRRTSPSSQEKAKGRLLHSCAAAAATTATAIIMTIVKLQYKHYVAFPPTSRCCRSTINASYVRQILMLLILSVFLPGSRATLAATSNASDVMFTAAARHHPTHLANSYFGTACDGILFSTANSNSPPFAGTDCNIVRVGVLFTVARRNRTLLASTDCGTAADLICVGCPPGHLLQ